jgi:hypothetical protein
MTMHRLRYTGVKATVFMHDQVGHVEPDGEFDVPEDRLLAYMRRADIEHAGECPAPPCRCGNEPEADPEPEAPAKTARAARARPPKQDDGEGAGSS